MNTERHTRWIVAGVAWVAFATAIAFGCEGPPGPPGPSGPPGALDASTDAHDAHADAKTDARRDGGPDGNVTPSSVVTGPGLQLAISSSSISATGVVTVSFTVTDGSGVPLDYSGTYTTGAVTAKWVISWLGAADADGGIPSAYTAYTTQIHTSVDGTKHEALPDSDVGGTLTEIGVGQGTYQYVFGTKLPAGIDGTKTHTIGAWATRPFGGSTYVANTLYDFVPNGMPVTMTRDITTTQACNQCHNPLGYHEGNTARRSVGLCVLCHATPAVDVSNGNGLDMPSMIHKVHRGRFLPSVLDGGTYQLTEDETITDAGVDGSAVVPGLVDHSGAWFPNGQIQNCAMCHQGGQGSTWRTAPSRAACGACHDLTSFVYPPPAGMTLHPGGQQTTDSTCLNAGCHGPSDHYAIATVHATPSTDPTAPTLTLSITRVTSTAPGQTPVLHFTVTQNAQPLDILATPLPWLAVTVAGPTTDYVQAEPLLYPIEGSAGDAGVDAGSPLALDGPIGSYAFTLPVAIPASATGSYAVGMEGYLQPAGATGPIYAALNPVIYVAVTDASPVPRRTVVAREKCNSCHFDLLAHGGTRKSPEYCVLCHTPAMVGDENAPRFEVPTTTAPSEHFKVLVHRIHRGNQLAQGYVVGGYPAPTLENPGGTPVDFGQVQFPGDLRACWACHASTSYLPPLPTGVLPTLLQQTLACTDSPLSPAAYCVSQADAGGTVASPLTAACTTCHDAPAEVAHAQANTAPDGTEACVVCHGTGQPWDVQSAHTLPP